MSSGVVSKKLKFKGDKPKKKKRSHRQVTGGDELEAMATADPTGWMFPEDAMDITGPTYILLPTEPLTCLAWDPSRQRVYAAPVDVPQAPEGANDLTSSEILQAVEPTDVNHVWVVSRLAGSEDVVSLRTSTGTFLSALPSGALTATAASRGPLEAFKPQLTRDTLFPALLLKTHADTFVSAPSTDEATIFAKKAELRADADAEDEGARLRVKCQREHVFKARMAAEAQAGTGKRRMLDDGPAVGSVEDELRRNRDAQAWGAGRHEVSSRDRREIKRAAREGRAAEVLLDRRAAMKSDRYAK